MKTLTNSPDPRAKRTRLLLQQALGEMLTRRSFSSVTVAEITHRAGVNRATFYAHFQDKDDLLESTLREKCRQVLQAALPPGRPPTPGAWQTLLYSVLEFFALMPCRCPQAARQWNGIVANAMREELNSVLEDWLSETTPAPGQTVIAAISGAIVTSGLYWLRGQAAVSTAEGAAELTAFVLKGLG